MANFFYDKINNEKGIFATDTTIGSGKECLWKCPKCNRIFLKQAYALNNNLKNGEEACPFCSGKIVSPENSLLIQRRDLVMKYFAAEKNFAEDIRPCALSVSSDRKIWVYDNDRKNIVLQRVADFSKGHYAFNKVATDSYNLKTKYPGVIQYINMEKCKEENIECDPEKILLTSRVSLHWNCPYCGEDHKKRVSERVNQQYGCPKYNAIYQASIPERILLSVIKDAIPDVESKVNINNERLEIDIFSKKYSLAIEYDGGRHTGSAAKIRDEKKNKYCYDNGIFLIRVREDRCGKINMYGFPKLTCHYSHNYSYMHEVITETFNIIIAKYKRDDLKLAIRNTLEKLDLKQVISATIWSSQKLIRYNSLGVKYPDLLKLMSEEDKKRAFTVKPKSSQEFECICVFCDHKYIRSAKRLVNTKGYCPNCRKHIIN